MSSGFAFDSNIVTFFLTASAWPSDPAMFKDDVRTRQRVAAFRLWMYLDDPAIVPIVWRECGAIPADRATGRTDWQDVHYRWMAYHWREVLDRPALRPGIEERAQELGAHHSGERNRDDCLVVAECEQLAEVGSLLTFDTDLIDHLAPVALVRLLTPADYWTEAAVPHGATPRFELRDDHPLARSDWWRW